jgi:hypothetical protein
MDHTVDSRTVNATFNGVLEAGVRATAILWAAHPRRYDLQRLIAFDYLLVHTADVGGPDSLHPTTPLHTAALLVRRPVVEQGLLLMMTRHLVERDVRVTGVEYRAGENAAPFLTALESTYLVALRDRAVWLAASLGDQSDDEFRSTMQRLFGQWVHEFNDPPGGLGVNT